MDEIIEFFSKIFVIGFIAFTLAYVGYKQGQSNMFNKMNPYVGVLSREEPDGCYYKKGTIASHSDACLFGSKVINYKK